MDDKIIIVESLVPEVQKRINEREYVIPWMTPEQKRYADLFMKSIRCRYDFKYWFDNCVMIKKPNAD